MSLAVPHPAMSILPSIPLHLKQLWCSLQCYSNAKMFAHINEILGIQASVCLCVMIFGISPPLSVERHQDGKDPEYLQELVN